MGRNKRKEGKKDSDGQVFELGDDNHACMV